MLLDVNIQNHEGIEAAKEALNSVIQKPITTEIIIRLRFWYLH